MVKFLFYRKKRELSLLGLSHLIEDGDEGERQLPDPLEVSLIQQLFEFDVYQVRQPMREAAVLRRRIWQRNLDGPGCKHKRL